MVEIFTKAVNKFLLQVDTCNVLSYDKGPKASITVFL